MLIHESRCPRGKGRETVGAKMFHNKKQNVFEYYVRLPCAIQIT